MVFLILLNQQVFCQNVCIIHEYLVNSLLNKRIHDEEESLQYEHHI